ncbi:BRCA1-A complex subunit RAP80 isoform X1 [Phodopus roborovskii]|uniref:BRCA1-A complex subunit RAP80 n=1 Tax=Phodopus roborovskii TaxID=109678 RepID=A0AAU9ZMF4_PHORO|nr:BRCA1-A complex subunit RAP80 isoform X1 [Phodopus roborovskii]CAH6798288.1 Uimc1 [Phodopus roborovskii]
MPRRKKKFKEASESQTLEKDPESTSCVSVKKKRRLEDLLIVISDSDGEEAKEENGLQKMKMKQSNRSKCLAKRKIAQMSEEEQFALALKMSEQEAREVNSQEEKEEELLKKAIAESLNSCWSSDASATRSRPLATGPSSNSHQENTKDSGTTEGVWQLVPSSLFKGSHVSQGNEAEERKEPWDHNENPEEEPVSGSSGSWDQSSQPVFENENLKCFDRCTGPLAEHTQCGKLQESTGSGSAFPKAVQGRGDTSRQCLPNPADTKGLQDTGGTVHYYWGIPFCPAGVDPNQYTNVILCQLEVYQKSLKMAQRQLFKKRGFGEPVLPRPPFLIQNGCGQEDETSEKDESISEDTGEEAKEQRQESRASVSHSETKDFQKSPIKSLKQKLLLEEEPTTSHGQSSQGLFVEETSEEVLKSSEEGNSVPAAQSIAASTSKRSLVLMPESSADEITVCPETQLSSHEPFDNNREDSSDSSKIPIEVRRTVSDKQADNRDGEKANPTPAFSSSARVPCPLCGQDFLPTKIEQHAMYCNGLVEQQTVLTRRQREAKNKRETALDVNKKEKCYLCKSLVPLEEYQSHVEACLQLARDDGGDGTEGGKRARVCAAAQGKQQRLRKPKEKGPGQGRLLSLLEQSEHKTTGVEKKSKSSEARPFRIPSPEVEEASCSGEMQSSVSQLNLNESPIKSFVPVSEATNCLVDFKDQFTFRSRTKSGRGRRKKS